MGYRRANQFSAERDNKKLSKATGRNNKRFCFGMKCPAASCAAVRRGGLCWGARSSCCSSFNSEDGEFAYFDSKELVILELENRRRARLSDSSAATAKAIESLRWVFSPVSGKLHMAVPTKGVILETWVLPDAGSGKGKEDRQQEEAEKVIEEDVWEEAEDEEFFSVRSCFSRCSSEKSGGGGDVEMPVVDDVPGLGCNVRIGSRKSLLEELGRHCDGWPFGLRKNVVAAVLPPLPRSPSDSWTWRSHRGGGTILYKLLYAPNCT